MKRNKTSSSTVQKQALFLEQIDEEKDQMSKEDANDDPQTQYQC